MTMTPIHVFISSVQHEFAREREHLRDDLRGDPLMRRFFDFFLVEDAPASDQRPAEVHLDEVDRCEIYVGLFGTDYGFEDADGISPTEREFDRGHPTGKEPADLPEEREEARASSEDAGAERQGEGRTGETALRQVGGAGGRRVRRARPLPQNQAIGALRIVRRDSLFGAAPDDLNVERMYRFIRVARRSLPPPFTVEKLSVAHQSLPANALIAEATYLLRYIEEMGTGTVDMIRRYREAGAGLVTRIWRPTGSSEPLASVRATTQETQDTTQEGRIPAHELGETTQESGDATQECGRKADSLPARDRILARLRSHPTLTRATIASRIGITPDGVKYDLDKLRNAGRVRHVGPTRRGRWEVLESEATRP